MTACMMVHLVHHMVLVDNRCYYCLLMHEMMHIVLQHARGAGGEPKGLLVDVFN